MSRRLPHTPSSQIRSALRVLTLRCRERAQALRAADRRCSRCGVKHSSAAGRHVTVEAHHLRPPAWDRVIAVIREELLQTPSDWLPLCEACHDQTHKQAALAPGCHRSGDDGDERPLVCLGRRSGT